MKEQDGWIRIEDWCLRYDERKNTVHKRVTDGAWERGIHYSAPDGGDGFVHEARARTWLEERGKLKL